MTYNVFGGTLSLTQSINHSKHSRNNKIREYCQPICTISARLVSEIVTPPPTTGGIGIVMFSSRPSVRPLTNRRGAMAAPYSADILCVNASCSLTAEAYISTA